MMSPNENQILDDFKVFMASVDGGKKKAAQITKHSSTLMKIVRFKSKENVSYKNLSDRQYLNEWQTHEQFEIGNDPG